MPPPLAVELLPADFDGAIAAGPLLAAEKTGSALVPVVLVLLLGYLYLTEQGASPGPRWRIVVWILVVVLFVVFLSLLLRELPSFP